MSVSITPCFHTGHGTAPRSGHHGRPTTAEAQRVRAYVLEKFNAGRSVLELAAAVGRKPNSVIKSLRAAGIPENHPRLTTKRAQHPQIMRRIGELVAAGDLPVKAIACEVNRSVNAVRRNLWALGYRAMLLLPEERAHIMARRRASAGASTVAA